MAKRKRPIELFPGAIQTGKCRGCGCTEARACRTNAGIGCHWVDAAKTLCSECHRHHGEWAKTPRLTHPGE